MARRFIALADCQESRKLPGLVRLPRWRIARKRPPDALSVITATLCRAHRGTFALLRPVRPPHISRSAKRAVAGMPESRQAMDELLTAEPDGRRVTRAINASLGGGDLPQRCNRGEGEQSCDVSSR